jgi:hypothetical protein
MFGKYNGFVSKARVSACMYFLVYIIYNYIQAFPPTELQSPVAKCKFMYTYYGSASWCKVLGKYQDFEHLT